MTVPGLPNPIPPPALAGRNGWGRATWPPPVGRGSNRPASKCGGRVLQNREPFHGEGWLGWLQAADISADHHGRVAVREYCSWYYYTGAPYPCLVYVRNQCGRDARRGGDREAGPLAARGRGGGDGRGGTGTAATEGAKQAGGAGHEALLMPAVEGTARAGGVAGALRPSQKAKRRGKAAGQAAEQNKVAVQRQWYEPLPVWLSGINAVHCTSGKASCLLLSSA
jgi:hypothetical protein